MRTLLVTLILGMVACGQGGDAGRARPAPMPRDATITPAADATPDACVTITTRWKAAFASASRACATDADCGCFNGGIVDGDGGCGGVAATASVAALESIRGDFTAARCPMVVQCAPWACAPRCVQGTCTR